MPSVLDHGSGDARSVRSGVRVGTALAESQNLARDLSNEPPNTLPPAELASAAQKMAREVGLRCRVYDVPKLEKLGAGIVLTGGTVAIPGVVALAQQIFASPVRLGAPSEGLSGLADSVRRPRFAVAAGLALWGADRFAETGRGASTLTSGVFTKLGTWLKEFF